LESEKYPEAGSQDPGEDGFQTKAGDIGVTGSCLISVKTCMIVIRGWRFCWI